MPPQKREKDLNTGAKFGGRYAETTRAPTEKPMTAQPADGALIYPLPDSLDPDLIASIPDDHNGISYVDNWNERFEILTRTDITADPVEYVKDTLGLTSGHVDLAMYRRAGDPRSNRDLNNYVLSGEDYDSPEWTAVAVVDIDRDVDNLSDRDGLLFRMQSDWDEDSNRYIIALPDQDEARKVYLGRADRIDYERAKTLYDQIASGEASPLNILGFNPKTMETFNEVMEQRRKAEVPEPPKDVFGYYASTYRIEGQVEQLGEERIKPLIEALQGNRPLDDTDAETIWGLVSNRGTANRLVEKTRSMYEAKQRLAKLDRVKEVLDAGDVPPLVAEYLIEDGALEKDLSRERRRVESDGALAKSLRGWLRPAMSAVRKRKELDAKAKVLDDARYWPGDPKTMPVEFAEKPGRTYTGDPGPFDDF